MTIATAGSQLLANNVAVTTGASRADDLDVSNASRLTVIWRLKGTVTVGDLTLNVIKPYYPDGTTLANAVYPASSTTAVAVGGADILAVSTYDLRGVQKVQVSAKNNNAGTLNLDVVVLTS